MKKAVAAFAVLALLLTAVPATALAHRGSCHGTKAKAYELCPYEECLKTSNHRHDGVIYSCHFYGDGHDYHHSSSRGAGHHRR